MSYVDDEIGGYDYCDMESNGSDDYHYEELVHTTEKAWLLKIEDKEYWFPKSQCSLNKEEKKITVPNWLAEEKELI